MSVTWHSIDFRYSAERDSIELVASDGEVVSILHRNAIIRMLGMLPANPPAEDESA